MSKLHPLAVLASLALLLAACAPQVVTLPPASTQQLEPTDWLPAITQTTPLASPTSTLQPPAPVESLQPAPQVAAPRISTRLSGGSNHTCLVTDPGGVLCWGGNDFGQLGTDAGVDYEAFGKPVEVIGIPDSVATVSAGAYHTCVLTVGGAVDCWGQNQSGQLGNGTTTDGNKPIDVNGLAGGITQISAGYAHTCALTAEGGVKCWGLNESGTLGDGTTINRNTPVDVQGLPGNAVQVAAGWVYTCALMESGEVWCWGDGSNGRFGTGPETVYATPVEVGGQIQNVQLLAAGQNHLCALTEAGQVLCWGSLTSEAPYTSEDPMVIEGLSAGIVEMVAGGGHTCALNGAGGVQCWGDNYFSQLGDGTDLASWAPVNPVGLTSGVTAIGSGSGHACALLEHGLVQCWGDGSGGQLGDGNVSASSILAAGGTPSVPVTPLAGYDCSAVERLDTASAEAGTIVGQLMTNFQQDWPAEFLDIHEVFALDRLGKSAVVQVSLGEDGDLFVVQDSPRGYQMIERLTVTSQLRSRYSIPEYFVERLPDLPPELFYCLDVERYLGDVPDPELDLSQEYDCSLVESVAAGSSEGQALADYLLATRNSEAIRLVELEKIDSIQRQGLTFFVQASFLEDGRSEGPRLYVLEQSAGGYQAIAQYTGPMFTRSALVRDLYAQAPGLPAELLACADLAPLYARLTPVP